MVKYDPPPGVGRISADFCDVAESPPMLGSAHVLLVQDAWTMDMVSRVMPNATIVCRDGSVTGARAYRRCYHQVAERIQTSGDVGHPEKLREWFSSKSMVKGISTVPGYRTFTAIGKFPGMRSAELGAPRRGETRKTPKCLKTLSEMRLIFVWRDRWYLTKQGRILTAQFSRVSPNSIHQRFERYDNENFRRHEYRHDDGVNSFKSVFDELGVIVEPGWRQVVNIPNGTQIRPDAWMYVEEGPLGCGWHAVEYELSQTAPSGLRRKLRPYRFAARRGSPVPMLMVCADARAENNVGKVAPGLPVLTCTVERVQFGPLMGGTSMWSDQGRATSLRFRQGS